MGEHGVVVLHLEIPDLHLFLRIVARQALGCVLFCVQSAFPKPTLGGFFVAPDIPDSERGEVNDEQTND